MTNEFERFAALDRGISSTTLGRYHTLACSYTSLLAELRGRPATY